MKIETVLILIASLRLSSAYHLGFFVPIGPAYTADGRGYAHALTIAIDDINNNRSILPGHNLSFSWTNSWRSDAVLQSMYSKYISPCNKSTPVDVFIGPAFHCSAPAKVAESFNIPMLSYVSISRSFKYWISRSALSSFFQRGQKRGPKCTTGRNLY